ncbi:hypothetical protein EYF80_065422 [Liparis tanakae]|uniref:Uncharacterized protein n=1 Tax=Liparis tanakae TaxID=230148 RepID=A0A4Z2E729_9TELE|nr:hypothetical protein EYF80_065422 [Liparis tanakae]
MEGVMNERRWRTPKAVISDPPPTSRRRQTDNEGGREKERKKEAEDVTSQPSKKEKTSERGQSGGFSLRPEDQLKEGRLVCSRRCTCLPSRSSGYGVG